MPRLRFQACLVATRERAATLYRCHFASGGILTLAMSLCTLSGGCAPALPPTVDAPSLIDGLWGCMCPAVTWCHLVSLQGKMLALRDLVRGMAILAMRLQTRHGLEARPTPAKWEADCVTYSRDGNILNRPRKHDLWKLTSEKKACFMSFYVRASHSKNGKFDARRLLREGICFITCEPVTYGK
jgi:hypothetical protein